MSVCPAGEPVGLAKTVTVVGTVLLEYVDERDVGVGVEVDEQTPTTTVISVAPGNGPELITDGTDPLGHDGNIGSAVVVLLVTWCDPLFGKAPTVDSAKNRSKRRPRVQIIVRSRPVVYVLAPFRGGRSTRTTRFRVLDA